MSSFAQRLEDVIHTLKIEKQEFAAAGDVTKATFSGYISGKQHPNRKTLSNWVRNFGINANWLLLGEGPMFRDELEKSRSEEAGTKTELGKELADIKTTLQTVGASEEEIKQALLDYVSEGRSIRDRRTGTDDDSR